MKNKKKVIQFPSKPQLTHYSELLRAESKRNQQFYDDVLRRAEEIMKKTKKRDQDQ